MCQILFVVPSFEKWFYNECIGTLLLATILKEKGVDAELLRFWQVEELDDYDAFLNKMVDAIIKKKPRIVSLYMRCDTDIVMFNIAERIKSIDRSIHIIAGGPQSSIIARKIIKEVNYIDFVCKGEGETTIYPIVDAILHGKDYSDIPGLVWKKNGQIFENDEPELIKNLDDNTAVDYSLVPIEYNDNSASIWEMDVIAIDVGRGCPFGCTYCSTKTFWKRKYRLKSNKKIIEEIESAVKQTGCRHFIFNHDLFTANRERIVSFCNEMIERNIDVKWTCSSRVDTIDEELILLMKKAGMEKIFFGIETGSPRMQRIINKNIDVDKVVQLIRFTGKNRIFSTTSFIYGFPEETEDDIEYTLKLIINLAEYSHNFVITHLLAIETGAEMFERYKNELVFTTKYSDVTEGFGRDRNQEFITKHPELFPHFMEYHSELRDRLEYVPHFVALLSRFYYTMYYMYSFIEQKNALAFYEHFVKINYVELVELSKTRALKDLLINPECLLLKYLNEYKNNKYNVVIREILRFESDRFQTQLGKMGSATIEKEYKFNYMDVICKADLISLPQRHSLISINKDDSGKINIQLKKLIDIGR